MPKPDDSKAVTSSSHDPLPCLESLQSEIDLAKSLTDRKDQGGDSANAPKDVGDAMRVGIELVSGVAVGGICGFFLDRWLHTLPLFFILGFFLGAAAGFRNMVREARKNTD